MTMAPPTTAPSAPAQSIRILLGGYFFVRAAGFAYPFLAFLVAARGHQTDAAAAVLAVFAVASGAGQIVCGWAVDRFGARRTVVVAMSLAGLFMVALAQAHSVATLIAGAALVGLVYDAPRPALGATITAVVPDPSRRAKLDSFRFGWINNGGAAIAGGVGGLLADRTAIPVLFWVDGLACVAFAVIARCLMPADAQTRHRSHRSAQGARWLVDRRLALFLASSSLTLTAFMCLYTVLPMSMTARGMAPGSYGVVQVAAAGAAMACTPFLTPRLSRWVAVRPRPGLLAVTSIWTATWIAAAALAPTTLGCGLAVAVAMPGVVAWMVVATDVIHRIAPAAQRGRYHGMFGLASAAAAVIAPVLGAYTLHVGGAPLVAMTTVAVGVIGAAVCLPLWRSLAGAD